MAATSLDEVVGVDKHRDSHKFREPLLVWFDMSPGPDLQLQISDDTLSKVVKRLSSPINLHGIDLSALDARDTPLPTPASASPRIERASSFFGMFGASQSANLLRSHEDDAQPPVVPPKSPGWRPKTNQFPYSRRAPGSTPELSLVGDGKVAVKSKNNVDAIIKGKGKDEPTIARDDPIRHRAAKSDLTSLNTSQYTSFVTAAAAATTATATATSEYPGPSGVASGERHKVKANQKRFPQVLTRSRSLRADARKMVPASPQPSTPGRGTSKEPNGIAPITNAPLSRSALPEKERSLKDAFKSSYRNRSEDRAVVESEEDKTGKQKPKKDKKADKHKEQDKQDKDVHPLASGYKKNNNSTFFSDIKSTGSSAASGVGKAGKASMGIFSKLMRSGSSNERVGAGPEEEYVPRILRLPLVAQTRATRIAKSYDHCRDKTEFWMPALPWRCIDFLNGKCEEEGLYRISGGLSQVKEWRKRFDIEKDINLLDETDLLDSSIIASLFKEWVRELPEEIFPKDIQSRVGPLLSTDEPGKARVVPQALRDELSNLPPFNYYLLFAITCHLSLLLSHEPKNKMTLDNLYRCFNQSLKLDGRIFYILVGEWRQCWQGCLTEDQYLAEEYKSLNLSLNKPTPYLGENQETVTDERAIASSSGDSASSANGRFTPEPQRPATSHNHPILAGQATSEPLTPVRNKYRSSSDVTGMSPIRHRA